MNNAAIRIEPYTSAYFDKLLLLQQQWGEPYSLDAEQLAEQLPLSLNHPYMSLLIAIDERERVVGYVLSELRHIVGMPTFVEAVALIVDKSMRSCGVGKSLLERVASDFAPRGAKELRLHSNVLRSRAHVFYEREGFQMYKISKFYAKAIG